LATETTYPAPELTEYVSGVFPEATALPLIDVIEVNRPTIGVPAALTDFTLSGTETGLGFASKDTSFEKSPVRAPYGLGSVLLVT
jgi:hypothetical protein